MKNPIIVALDVDDPKRAISLFSKLATHVGGFKIGPRLTFRVDRSFLNDLSKAGVFFFDHKFFDIPSTTASAVEAAAELGATWVTVHGLNGPHCLKNLAQVEQKIRSQKPTFRVLVVTVLTSFDKSSLPPIWKDQSIEKSVAELAQSAQREGLGSFVCSPFEVNALREKYPDSFLVVPGVRPPGDATQDQQRVATPPEALEAGASALVIGRPIVDASDPLAATLRILDSLKLNK